MAEEIGRAKICARQVSGEVSVQISNDSLPMNAERPSLRRRIEQLFPRLSLFGRSVTLIAVELIANLIFWVAGLMLWIPTGQKGIISLALIAWTLGLRHGLDM